MANNSNRKAIEFMVQGALPPHSTNVLWMDTSVPTLPVLKIFENGSWATVHTGDSKAVELLAETILAQQEEITELTAEVAKESTLTQGVQNIREAISHIDIDTSDLAKEATLGISSDISVATTIFGWLKSIRDFLVGIVTTNPYAKEASVKDGNDTAIGVSKSVYGALTDNTNGLSAIKNAIPTVADIQNGLAKTNELPTIPTDYAKSSEIPSVSSIQSGLATASALSSVASDAAAAKVAAQSLTSLESDINAGKTALATAITAKGVTTFPTQSMSVMAQNISSIVQETIEINGGDMYAKQLFGSLTTPNYWNLYDVMAYLLTKTSIEQYSILLCEFPKGDVQYVFGTGVSAGSIPVGYVFSDDWQLNGEGSLNIHANTESGHVWNDDLDMKGNRWVAWLFPQVLEGGIASTVSLGVEEMNCPQPRSIHIGRHMGTITATTNGVLSEIVVTDGNVLDGFVSASYTQAYNRKLIVKNIASHSSNTLLYGDGVYLYLQIKSVTAPGGVLVKGNYVSVIIDLPNTINIGTATGRENNRMYGTASGRISTKTFIISGLKVLRGLGIAQNATCDDFIAKDLEDFGCGNGDMIRNCTFKRMFFPVLESASNVGNYVGYCHFEETNSSYMYLGYKTNDYTKSVVLLRRNTNTGMTSLTDIELKDGYLKPLNIASLTTVLTAKNIALHMLDRLGTCTAETGQLTLKIGATNLATIQNDSTYSSYLTEATTTKGWAVIA